jgi:AcrB/AcrD/AcrF family
VLAYSYARDMAVGGRDTGLAVRKEEETKILQRWSLLGGDFCNPRMRCRAVRTAWTGSYINKLRQEGMGIRAATREASLLRLRPIMMKALVACLGLLPAALSTGIGSDTQRPFAIVIVAGLISRLFIGFFVNPVLYEMVAREGDVLQVRSKR